jgi:hypothetical protein
LNQIRCSKTKRLLVGSCARNVQQHIGQTGGGARWEAMRKRECLVALKMTPFLYSYFRICDDSVGSDRIILNWILLKTECEGVNFTGTFNWSSVCVSLVGPSRSAVVDWLRENVFTPDHKTAERVALLGQQMPRSIDFIAHLFIKSLHTLLSVFLSVARQP